LDLHIFVLVTFECMNAVPYAWFAQTQSSTLAAWEHNFLLAYFLMLAFLTCRSVYREAQIILIAHISLSLYYKNYKKLFLSGFLFKTFYKFTSFYVEKMLTFD
jgi:hypothetical protein